MIARKTEYASMFRDKIMQHEQIENRMGSVSYFCAIILSNRITQSTLSNWMPMFCVCMCVYTRARVNSCIKIIIA